MRGLAAAVALALLAPAAAARLPAAPYANRPLADPSDEAAAKALMAQLRCLVCAGQSIADSDADMAGDMRSMVRERIGAGERPEAVRDWLIARYGREVSYRPPLAGATALLWAAPALMLLAGFLVARASFRRRR